MTASKQRFALAAGIASLALLAFPSLAGANPGTGPELVQRSGRMVILHADRADGSSTRQWALLNGVHHLPVEVPADVWIAPGSKVRLEGTMRNGDLVLANSLSAVAQLERSPLEQSAGNLAAAPSLHSTAVILVSFASGGPAWTTPPNPDAPAATSLIFGDPLSTPGSLNAYYLEQTYGQLGLQGQVFGPVSIPGPSSECGESSPNYDGDALDTWLADAEQAAGVADGAYQHIIVALPEGVSCGDVDGALGLAELGGKHIWINGALEVPVVAHEFGHNLGLAHAGGLRCTNSGSAAPMGNSCSADTFEYKDPYDAMGQSDVGIGSMVLRQMNMQHKLMLNLLPASAVQVAGVSGTYQLAPMETLTGAVELLRVPRPGGGTYFVEYRYPVAGGHFDNQPPSFSGVYIRTESPQYVNGHLYPNGADTVLLDMHPTTGPPTAPWADAALSVGQVFNDPLSGIMVQNLSQGSSGAVLGITMPLDVTPPDRPARLSAVVGGTTVALQWTAATDDRAVASYLVARDGAALGATTGFAFTDPAAPAGATVVYTVAAVDTTGNVGPAAAVSATIPDTVAPSAPTPVAATVSKDGQVHISWGASADNRAVTSYRVLRNGTGIVQANVRSYVDKTPRPGGGATVTYSVVAFDLVGNASPPGRAKPLRAALLRKLGVSHVKVVRVKHGKRKLVRVKGTVSDVEARCRLRIGKASWRTCKAKPTGAFSVDLPARGTTPVTLSLRDSLGRVKLQTLRVR